MTLAKNFADEEKALLDEWRANALHFIYDGIFDWDSYLVAKRKIIFVLKDAYDDTSDRNGAIEWNLQAKRKGKNEGDGITHHTDIEMARWAYGITHLEDGISWTAAKDAVASQQDRHNALLPTGQINVKKSPSLTATTHVKDLIQAVECPRNRSFLTRQWELYRPDITICGSIYPFWCMYTALGGTEKQVIPIGKETSYWKNPAGGILIHTCHPAARGKNYSPQEKYGRLMHAVGKALAA